MKKLFTIALSVVALVSCKEENPVTPLETPLSAVIDSNIFANYTNYQYYSFATGDTVPFADSLTTNWDIAFKGTTVLVNSGTSGPGIGGAIIFDTLFSEVTTAPTTGYAQDGVTKAIPAGSGNGWYNYDGATFTITPLAGKVFVIKTATGKYAKLEFISYYKDAPASPDGLTHTARYYTIRYIYQPDGSTKLN